MNFCQRAFCCLHKGDAVVCVFLRCFEAFNLSMDSEVGKVNSFGTKTDIPILEEVATDPTTQVGEKTVEHGKPTESFAFFCAASRPLICALIFSEIARPAASSPARLIL
mgnify:CR=1 FL=1